MAVSIAQYVDLLFKKLQGVAKTANSTVKSASNESIASPAFLRGDIVWMQSDQIPATAQAVSNIANARINGNSVQCVADTTVPPVGGIYPTWLSNVPYWIPQELGATWLPKVFVGPAAAANIQATGTQIFAAGIGGVGEYYFDTQAGVLNFIGETIPSVLTAGNVVYISGYEYTGAIGVTNQPGNVTIGNLSITSTTSNRVLYTNNDNFVVTSSNLTFDGSLLALTGTANVSANVSVGNLYSAGLINAVGNITGNNVIANGNVNGNNFNVTTELSVGGNAIISGNLVVNGNLVYVNVTDLNVEDPIIGIGRGPNNAPLTTNDGKDRGEQLWYYSGSEKSAFIGYDNSTGNLLAAVDVTIANEIVTVNQFGTWQIGNLYGESALITGNIDAANISSTGNILAIGNVMAGNVISSGAVIGNIEISGNLIVANLTVTDYFQGNIVNISNTISAMGTITGGNLVSNAAISASTTISATGNITGGNIATIGLTTTGTLETTGNALIGGNLFVQGNLTYINIDDLRIEDPIIILGTGPNGAPLTVNDGKDRGIYMEYYTTGLGNAFVGFKNSSGNMVIANNVDFTANDVVGINSYGTLEAGNLYIQSAVSTGNVTGSNLTTAGQVVATGNVTGGNLNTSGTINATGNVNGTGAVFSGNITAQNFIGNVDAGGVNTNIQFNDGDILAGSAAFTFDKTSNAVTASGNITGGNLLTGGLITVVGNIIGSGAVFSGNVTSNTFIGNIVSNTGTVGNLTFGNTTISTNLVNGNITLAATGNSFVQIGGTYGFVVPVGNTAQRLATGNLVGTVRFNTDVSRIEVYDGTEWDQIVAGVTNQVLYGDGSTETFTLDRSTTTAAVLVILNGITQVPVQSYSMVPSPSTNLVFTEAPEPGDVIDIRFL
jgi:hypothetical protein